MGGNQNSLQGPEAVEHLWSDVAKDYDEYKSHEHVPGVRMVRRRVGPISQVEEISVHCYVRRCEQMGLEVPNLNDDPEEDAVPPQHEGAAALPPIAAVPPVAQQPVVPLVVPTPTPAAPPSPPAASGVVPRADARSSSPSAASGVNRRAGAPSSSAPASASVDRRAGAPSSSPAASGVQVPTTAGPVAFYPAARTAAPSASPAANGVREPDDEEEEMTTPSPVRVQRSRKAVEAFLQDDELLSGDDLEYEDGEDGEHEQRASPVRRPRPQKRVRRELELLSESVGVPVADRRRDASGPVPELHRNDRPRHVAYRPNVAPGSEHEGDIELATWRNMQRSVGVHPSQLKQYPPEPRLERSRKGTSSGRQGKK